MSDLKFGASLASTLNDIIGDGEERDARINSMASAAGIERSTVNEILSGSINCPPLSRLRGFARALGVSVGRLTAAAGRDGCNYDTAESSDPAQQATKFKVRFSFKSS